MTHTAGAWKQAGGTRVSVRPAVFLYKESNGRFGEIVEKIAGVEYTQDWPESIFAVFLVLRPIYFY